MIAKREALQILVTTQHRWRIRREPSHIRKGIDLIHLEVANPGKRFREIDRAVTTQGDDTVFRAQARIALETALDSVLGPEQFDQDALDAIIDLPWIEPLPNDPEPPTPVLATIELPTHEDPQ